MIATVRLLGLPVAVHRRAARHGDTLQREFALVLAGSEVDVGARLVALSRELDGRFGGLTRGQTEQLDAARDDELIDVVYEVPPDAADAAEALGTLLDEVDEFCRSGELVTLCTPPEAVAYRRWFLGEFIGQIREGRPPRPWSAGGSEAARSTPAAAPAPASPPLVVEGDLDLFGTPTLRAAIAERVEAGVTTIEVDLGGCEFVDSVGLSLLLTTRERCRAAGGALWVLNPGEATLRLFETVGVTEMLVRE